MEHLPTKTPCFCTLHFIMKKKIFLEFSETYSAFCFGEITFGECRKSEKSFISSILKGEREEKINRVSQEFVDKFYPKIIRENALEFIQNIDKENTESYLITASLDIWVKPFAEKMGMKTFSQKPVSKTNFHWAFQNQK